MSVKINLGLFRPYCAHPIVMDALVAAPKKFWRLCADVLQGSVVMHLNFESVGLVVMTGDTSYRQYSV
jgi:hypothetical protein